MKMKGVHTMTKCEIVSQLEQEGIDPANVSLSAVNAYRATYFEKSGHVMGFLMAVREMYGKGEQGQEWIRMDGKIECRG